MDDSSPLPAARRENGGDGTRPGDRGPDDSWVEGARGEWLVGSPGAAVTVAVDQIVGPSDGELPAEHRPGEGGESATGESGGSAEQGTQSRHDDGRARVRGGHEMTSGRSEGHSVRLGAGRPGVVACHGVVAGHRYAQRELTAAVADLIGATGRTRSALERIHANAGVRHRSTALPIETYRALDGFGAANDAFIEAAVELGATAVSSALEAAEMKPQDVDLLVSATVTGLAVPSIDARIAAVLGMRPDLKRVPIVGLGCVAGAAGVARINDHLRGRPGETAVLVAVELCSLTVQPGDRSAANMVASGLFGDGAAAVVLNGAEAAGTPAFEVVETRSRLYPGTERAMGWDIGSSGLRIVLGVEVPELVRQNLRTDVDEFLGALSLTRADIGWWVAHPGGPKVLEAMQDALEITRDALGVTWESLAEIGNLSSASVLHVLADTMRDRPRQPGSLGMMLAMGPGFCLEMVLLRAAGTP